MTTTIFDAAIRALEYLRIETDSHYENGTFTEPTKWFVVDTQTAEPDVNWPGELISEHDTRNEAKRGLAIAIARVLKPREPTAEALEATAKAISPQRWSNLNASEEAREKAYALAAYCADPLWQLLYKPKEP